ncbi:ATP-binding protein [Nocardioides sp. P5_E3]
MEVTSPVSHHQPYSGGKPPDVELGPRAGCFPSRSGRRSVERGIGDNPRRCPVSGQPTSSHPGACMPGTEGNWSHGTTLEATPISAAGARAFVSRHLVDHRLTYLVDPVRLVVSELATNALVHGQTPFVVTLSREGDTIRVTVSDDAAWIADSAPHQSLQVGGRGLVIVNVLSRDWGVITQVRSKTVWATFEAHPAMS